MMDRDTPVLGLGDYIDCQLCVQVCPTGIDIRDDQQSNCIRGRRLSRRVTR